MDKKEKTKRHDSALQWFMVLLLALLVAACGGGGGADGGNGVQILSQTSVPSASGAIAPGTVPSGTAAAASGPTVPTSNPTHGAANVAVSSVGADDTPVPRTISATFSEAMNPATIVSPATSFAVKETISGTSVPGTVSMEAANTVATFTPNAALASNTQFTATISTVATNTAGTPLVSNYEWTFTTGAQIGQAPVNLGTAASFVVLGGTSIDNVSTASNPTRVNGQLGIDPGSPTDVRGFTESSPLGSGIISTGGIQFGPVVHQAKNDLLAALHEANRRTRNQVAVGSSDLALTMVNGGNPGVYPPGLYSSGSMLTLSSGNMTLDAKGDPDAVWVFKAVSSLNVDDTRQILLVNGAKARNVFWSLGSSASVGEQVRFKGNILAGTSNTIGRATANGTTVEGRVLSISGLRLYATTINAPAP